MTIFIAHAPEGAPLSILIDSQVAEWTRKWPDHRVVELDRFSAIGEAYLMACDLASAESLEDLDRLYADWIGYSVVADDPAATFDSVRVTLVDWLEEFCSSTQVDSDVALRPLRQQSL